MNYLIMKWLQKFGFKSLIDLGCRSNSAGARLFEQRGKSRGFKPNDSYISKKFGYEWSIYPEIIPSHRDQFSGWISPFTLEAFKGKRFLDAGCGIGRNSLWPLEAGATSAYVFDFDQKTVQVAKNNLKNFPHCQVGFDSIYDVRFVNEFDIAFCIGVIHHLERPKEAVKKLLETVKPNGHLILWVYAREGNERFLLWFDPLRKFVTSHLPVWANLWMARGFTLLLKTYLLFPHRKRYLNLLKTRSFRHMEALVFDQLIPSIAHYWTRHEVLQLADGLPVEVEHLTHTNQLSWTLILKKKI